MHHCNAVGADDLLQRRPERLDEKGFVPAGIGHAGGGIVINFSHQMREHFAIGFGSEMMFPFAQQFILDRLVILDHAVVHERELAAFIEMRMRILVGRFAVGGPASVTDSKGASSRILRH